MKIALAYAMAGEIESLLTATGAKLLETVHGVPFYEIEKDLIAYAGGIGKVNAAMAAQLCIDRYQPDWMINAGVAGSFRDLPIGTVVVAERFLQHDVDTSPIGDPVGLVSTVNTLHFPTAVPEKIAAFLEQQGVSCVTGDVATGDAFLVRGDRADWIAKTFNPTLCEMEGGRHRPGVHALRRALLRGKVGVGPAVHGKQPRRVFQFWRGHGAPQHPGPAPGSVPPGRRRRLT